MDAVQAMNGHGGWPLTAFLTPDGRAVLRRDLLPARAAPRDAGVPAGPDRHRRRVARAPRRGRRAGRRGSSSTIARAAQLHRRRGAARRTDIADAAPSALRRSFDARWGGFGGAPKFPQPMTLEFLLRRCAARRARRARDGHDHARPHGRRRDLRPARRRLRPVQRPTPPGSSRTSRRCSTTTRSSRACTRARGW